MQVAGIEHGGEGGQLFLEEKSSCGSRRRELRKTESEDRSGEKEKRKGETSLGFLQGREGTNYNTTEKEPGKLWGNRSVGLRETRSKKGEMAE